MKYDSLATDQNSINEYAENMQLRKIHKYVLFHYFTITQLVKSFIIPPEYAMVASCASKNERLPSWL